MKGEMDNSAHAEINFNRYSRMSRADAPGARVGSVSMPNNLTGARLMASATVDDTAATDGGPPGAGGMAMLG